MGRLENQTFNIEFLRMCLNTTLSDVLCAQALELPRRLIGLPPKASVCLWLSTSLRAMADDGSNIGELWKRAHDGDEGHEGQKKGMKAERIMVRDAASVSRGLPVVVQLRAAIENQEDRLRKAAWGGVPQDFRGMILRLEKLNSLLDKHVREAATSSASSSTTPAIICRDRA